VKTLVHQLARHKSLSWQRSPVCNKPDQSRVAMAEARLSSIEAALMDRPTTEMVRYELEKSLDRQLQTIVAIMDARKSDRTENAFNFREAQYHKPQKWSGRKDKIDFVEFSNSLKNWAEALHDDGVNMIEEYEGQDQPVEEAELDTDTYEDIIKFNKALYTELIDCLTGEPLKCVLNKKRGRGIAAWREIVNWYDPRSQVDKSAAYAKIVNPGKRASNLSQAVDLLNAWESLISNYEMRHGQVEDVAKITGLKQILPEQLLDSQFRGKRYDKYNAFRQDVTNYINDKHTAGHNSPMEVDSLNAVTRMICEEHEKDEKSQDDDSWKEGDLVAAFMQFKGGKGYGKQAGHNAKAWQPPQWQSGKGSDHQQWHPPQQQSWQPYPQKGKSKGKGTKGKGKGQGKNPNLQCYSCKGFGHPAFLCPNGKSVNALEEPAEDNANDDGEPEDESMWLLMDKDPDSDDEGYEMVSTKRSKRKVKEEICSIEETKGKWVRISAGMDSCAAQTVMSRKMFPKMRIEQTEDSKNGKEYTAANGGKIKNEGQKIIPFTTVEGQELKMKVQIAEVTRMLISASKVANAGNIVNLDAKNPHIKNIKTGKVTKLRHKNGIFLLDVWVNTDITGPVFSRQGS
jgi:hypothetical protein